jgi:hypothetical protein
VGASAFWRTKPISGLRLLGAKLVVLSLVLILLPILLTLPWWLMHDLGFDSIRSALALTAWLQLLLIAVALPFAVLTRTLTGYLGWSVGVTLGCFSVALLASRLRGAHQTLAQLNPCAAHTRDWFVGLVLTFGLCAVVLHQYRTRRAARSLALAAGSVMLAVALGTNWRWDWSALGKLFSKNERIVAALQLQADGATVRQSAPIPGRHSHPPEAVSIVAARIEGVPPGHLVRPRFLRQELEWVDEANTSLVTFSPRHAADFEAQVIALFDLAPSAWDASSADQTLAALNVLPSTQPLHSEARLDATLLHDVVEKRPDLALTVQLQLVRPELAGEIELRESATFRLNNSLLRILSIQAMRGEATTISWMEIVPPSSRAAGGNDFFLVDRSHRKIVAKARASSSEHFLIAGTRFELNSVTFQNETDYDGNPRLLVIAYEQLGTALRRISIPHGQIDFQLAPQ